MIRVTYHRPNADAGTQGVVPPSVVLETQDHADADNADVREEHLYLYDGSNNQVGGYAPGWLRWEKLTA